MKKIYCICVLCVCLFATVAMAADALTEGPDDIVINVVKGNSDRDLSVTFNHSSHEGYECGTCHHKWNDGSKEKKFGASEVEAQESPKSCVSCHSGTEPRDTKTWRSYFRAMHKKGVRPSCLSCHIEEFEDDKEMVGCYESVCHTEGLY